MAKRLDALEARGILTLHDRRTPHSKWNFDHIVVGPSGVFTVDAKLYKAFLAEFRPVRR